MRRIDALAITVGFFAVGGIAYFVLLNLGFDFKDAGVWSQLVLVLGLLGWVSTYIFRAVTQTMTYNEQLDSYKMAVLKKRYEEMTPEEIDKLKAEVEAERNLKPDLKQDSESGIN